MRKSPLSGFTLIELLVVIAIIGILSAVVFASLNTAKVKANLSAGKQLDSTMANSLGDQLLGYWAFDDCSGTTAIDSSGNNVTATLVGGLTWDTNTPYGRGCALKFVSGSYAQIDTNTASSFSVQPNTARTFTAWFKDTAVTSGSRQIIWKNGNCIGWYVTIGTNGKLTAAFTTPACGSTVGYSVTSSATYNDGNWHQVALSIDRINGVLTLYVDGKSLGSTVVDTANVGSGGSFLVGNDWDYSQYFNGSIDEVRAYGSTLGLTDVYEKYMEELPQHLLAER